MSVRTMKILKAVAFLACLVAVGVVVGIQVSTKPETAKDDITLKHKHEQLKNYRPIEFHYKQKYKNKVSMKKLTRGKK